MKSALFRFFCTCVAVIFLTACGGRVIPREKLAHIYADMFLADQWLDVNPAAKRYADTTYVYEKIFEEYGYDSKDFRASVDKYMDDPERYSKILRRSASILEERLNELNMEKKVIQASKPDTLLIFDFDRIMVPDTTGMFRMADRDSLEYFRDRKEVLVFDPFYKDVHRKNRIKNSPVLK